VQDTNFALLNCGSTSDKLVLTIFFWLRLTKFTALLPMPVRAVSVTNNSSKSNFTLVFTKHEGLNVADNGIRKISHANPMVFSIN
jgi:hypothetical protein